LFFLPRTIVLGYSQPSLTGLIFLFFLPRTIALGYSQPSLAGLFFSFFLTQDLSSWATLSHPFGT
jgi:hypothetical protein